MTRGGLAAGALAALVTVAPGARLRAAPPPTVVVAELFTSEGCSSCPPAEALLQQIAAQQPVAGVEVIPLEEHVDYWDNLGWRDPFSAHRFTTRQSDYDARVFRSADIYTPQLVVDGVAQCIGSDRAAVGRLLAAEGRVPRATLRVAVDDVTGDHAVAKIAVDVPANLVHRGAADLIVVVTEGELTTAVRGGENRGRTLRHSAVVRSMTTAGALAPEQSSLQASVRLPVGRTWSPSHLQVVAFVQERDTRGVFGAASAALTR